MEAIVLTCSVFMLIAPLPRILSNVVNVVLFGVLQWCLSGNWWGWDEARMSVRRSRLKLLGRHVTSDRRLAGLQPCTMPERVPPIRFKRSNWEQSTQKFANCAYSNQCLYASEIGNDFARFFKPTLEDPQFIYLMCISHTYPCVTTRYMRHTSNGLAQCIHCDGTVQ